MTTSQASPNSPAQPIVGGGAPNQYHLHGHGVRISYYPGGAGPLTVDGPIILTYQDAHGSKVFRGEQAHVVDVAQLGTCVTVTLEIIIDKGSVTATVLIPTVVLPAGGSTTVETQLITTSHEQFLTGLGQPQRDHYTVTPLTGEASQHPLPH
jgi:hypothetical protein